MKNLLFLVCLIFSKILSAQNLQPTANKALIQFSINNFEKEKLNVPIYFFGKNSKKEFSTQKNDTQILLPLNDTYLVYSKIAIENYEIIVSNAPNQFYNVLFQFDNTKKNRLFATPLETVVQIKLSDHKNQGSKQVITFVNQNNQKQYKGTTNEDGFLEILLPNHTKYSIHIGATQNYSQIDLPHLPFDKIVKLLQFENELGQLQPSKDSALFNFTYFDLNQKPVKDEIIEIISLKTKKKFISQKTDNNGKTQIKVPIGDVYSLNTKYFKEFATQKVEAKPDLYVLPLNIRFPSSLSWEKQIEEEKKFEIAKEEKWKKMQKEIEEYKSAQEKMEKQRLEKEKKEEDIYFKNLMSEINKKRKEDSLIYLRDSLEAKTTQEKLLKTTKLKEKMAMQIRKHEDSIKVLKDSIRTAKLKMRIEEEKKYLTNKGFKIEQDSALLKAFQRNKHWKNQLLVVDVTGSMYVYLNQFKIWYSSKHNIFPNKMQFVLFNDGDDALKNNVYKKVGTTGGIYFSTTADFVDLETQMTKARQNGGGGDTPENDLEAVIKAIEKCKNYNEVILIADNTSQVRDIELLPKIKKPLRIILCGADFYVNGQYLEIAYKTKGSIHLLREDVDFSSKNLANYEKITIQNRTYMFVNERFFLLSDE